MLAAARPPWRWIRAYLTIGLIGSLTAMIAITARLVFVRIPAFAPLMVAELHFRPASTIAAGLCAIMAIATVTRAWSDRPGDIPSLSDDWRRPEGHYYHERRAMAWVVAGLALVGYLAGAWESHLPGFSEIWRDFVEFAFWPSGGLALALFLVASRRTLGGWRKPVCVAPAGPPRMNIAAFALTTMGLLTVLACVVPLLATWGVTIWYVLAR